MSEELNQIVGRTVESVQVRESEREGPSLIVIVFTDGTELELSAFGFRGEAYWLDISLN